MKSGEMETGRTLSRLIPHYALETTSFHSRSTSIWIIPAQLIVPLDRARVAESIVWFDAGTKQSSQRQASELSGFRGVCRDLPFGRWGLIPYICIVPWIRDGEVVLLILFCFVSVLAIALLASESCVGRGTYERSGLGSPS